MNYVITIKHFSNMEVFSKDTSKSQQSTKKLKNTKNTKKQYAIQK